MDPLVKTKTCRALAGNLVLLGLFLLPVSVPVVPKSLGPRSELVYERLQLIQPAAFASNEDRSAGAHAVKPLFSATAAGDVQTRPAVWRVPVRPKLTVLVQLQCSISPRSPPSIRSC